MPQRIENGRWFVPVRTPSEKEASLPHKHRRGFHMSHAVDVLPVTTITGPEQVGVTVLHGTGSHVEIAVVGRAGFYVAVNVSDVEDLFPRHKVGGPAEHAVLGDVDLVVEFADYQGGNETRKNRSPTS